MEIKLDEIRRHWKLLCIEEFSKNSSDFKPGQIYNVKSKRGRPTKSMYGEDSDEFGFTEDWEVVDDFGNICILTEEEWRNFFQPA